MQVVDDREMGEGKIAGRDQGGADLNAMPVEQFINMVNNQCG